MITRQIGTATTGLEGEFRYQMDLQGLSSSAGRNPTTNIQTVLNSSYRSLREFVTTCGYTLFLTRSATASLPTAATVSGEDYAQISVPFATQVVKAVNVKFGSEPWYPLQEVPFGQLRDATQWGPSTTPRRPRAWTWIQGPQLDDPPQSILTQGFIAVAPIPTSGSYCLWTLPEHSNIGANAGGDHDNTDLFLFHSEEWIQWLFAHTALKVCVFRDKDAKRKEDALRTQLNPDVKGSPAWHIVNQAPTQAGPKTWTRSNNYRSGGWGR